MTDWAPLHALVHQYAVRVDARELAEEVVERPDGAREQRRPPLDEVTLDAVDVDAVRDDEPRLPLEHVQVALQEQRDLADVSRPQDERETHRFIVVPALGSPSYAGDPVRAKSVETARNDWCGVSRGRDGS